MSNFNTSTYDTSSNNYNVSFPTYIEAENNIPVDGLKYYDSKFGQVMCSFAIDKGDSVLGGNVIISNDLSIYGNIHTNSIDITPIELSYLTGSTSNLQSQISSIPAGATGATGATGAQGPQGDSIVGPQGVKGDTGAQGASGVGGSALPGAYFLNPGVSTFPIFARINDFSALEMDLFIKGDHDSIILLPTYALFIFSEINQGGKSLSMGNRTDNIEYYPISNAYRVKSCVLYKYDLELDGYAEVVSISNVQKTTQTWN
jgi:hypothetical protein